MATRPPLSIGALFLAPSTYRHLPAIGWLTHGEVFADLRWQLAQHFQAQTIVLTANQLTSPRAARAAVDSAVRIFGRHDVLLAVVAGRVVRFTRREGDISALALPGSVPGRPGSMLAIHDLLAELRRDVERPLIICADLIGGPDVIAPMTVLPRAFVLASCLPPDAVIEQTCQAALAAALGDLAAAGVRRPASDVLQTALNRAWSAGTEASLRHDGEPVVLASRYVGEQVPGYVRDDLISPDPGSRLDAVTELAALSSENAFARTSLQRLHTHDRSEVVRSYADVMLGQSRQPAVHRLLAVGKIPRDIYEAALSHPDVPNLLPHAGGDITMGVDPPDGEDGCRPRHSAHLAPYRLARTVVTNRQYLAFLAAEDRPCPTHWDTDEPAWHGDDTPVVMVSWLDATRYCDWLTRHLQATGELQRSQRIVLPSEAEWEAAAGNRRGDPFPWGVAPDPSRSNIRVTGIGKVIAPGHFSPHGDNEAGCQDLIGNVWEWTRSLWGHSGHHPTYRYPYHPHDGREMSSARPGARYVIRGGAFYYATECANSYTRNRMLGTDRHPAGGFRVASIDVE